MSRSNNPISISNLFGCSISEKKTSRTGILNIKSLSNDKNMYFDVEKLSYNRLQKEKIYQEKQIYLYNLCTQKIDMMNNLNKTDYIYELSENETDKQEHLKYIETKLEEHGLKCTIIDDRSIFITWAHL